jgi:Rhs element Vgr protein
MNDERIIPAPASTDLPTYRILIDGQEISSEHHLVSLTVTKAVNKIPAAQIVLLDGDSAQEDFPLSSSDKFVPGKAIEILTGYHAKEGTIFKGVVTGHGIKTRKRKPSVLVLECKDNAVKMTIGRKNAYYRDVSDSEIIEEVISAYGLEAEIESTGTTHEKLVKYYTSDWDFVVSRAEVNGKLVIVDDGNIAVKAPDTGQQPALSLIYGSTMMEFEAQMDARSQFSVVKCASWNYTDQAILEEASEPAAFQECGNIDATTLSEVIGLEAFSMQHAAGIKEQELQAWANAKLIKSRLAKIIGRVNCQGVSDIKPGHMIRLNGVGDRFNGLSYVTAVRQQFTTKNWETEIQFGLSPQWFSGTERIVDTPSAGLLPAVHGLQIGMVTQLEKDPAGEDRVLVRMPLVDPAAEGIWARIACLDAGDKRGAFFRPEIDDEVVLGFLNDDPRDPVILGMLNSSAKPAPLPASDDNPEKGFVTRSQLKLVFNDKENSLTLETKNGNMITLSDDAGAITIEDENGNKLAMDASGISLESAKDVTIKTSGDISIEGTNIALKASAQVSAEGGSGAELTTNAVCVVKGSLVKIN